MRQRLEEGAVIAVLEEDLAARITAVQDMIALVANGGSRGAWYAVNLRLRPSEDKGKDECPLFFPPFLPLVAIVLKR